LGTLSRTWPKADWLPRSLRLKTALMNLSLNPARAYANTISICRPPLRRALLHGDVRSMLNGHAPDDRVVEGFGPSADDPLRGMISADIDMLLPDDFLTKVDRASMAVGLEVRPPLVDHEFLELAAQVPSTMKVRDGETKWLFKQICSDWLPHEIVHRRKQGFDIPVDEWLRGPLREVVEAHVLSPSAHIAQLIDTKCAARLYDKHLRRTGNYGNILWSILVLGAWAERYLAAKTPQVCERACPT
jgi:asparagine synthase (glutamine-hydrolysing)